MARFRHRLQSRRSVRPVPIAHKLLQTFSLTLPPVSCFLAGNMDCSGAPGKNCGGPDVRHEHVWLRSNPLRIRSSVLIFRPVTQALLIFTTSELPEPKPIAEVPTTVPATPLADGWTTAGACVVDNANGRLLKGPSKSDPAMTYAMCTDFCFSQGFRVAGLE